MTFAGVLRLLRHLDQRLRSRIAILGVFILLVSILEVVSTGAMFPLIAALVDVEGFHRNPVLSYFYQALESPSHEAFAMTFATLFFGVVCVKVFVSGLGYRYQYSLAYDIQRSLASRILRSYANERYATHMLRNPLDLLKDIQNEIPALANGVLVPSMQAISESLIAIAIVALLISINPFLTLVLAVGFVGVFLGLYKLTRRSNDSYGAQRSTAVGDMYRGANTVLSGLKELRVLNKVNTFVDKYDRAAQRYGTSNAHIMFVAQIPRLTFELLGFGSFVAVVLYAGAVSMELRDVLPLIATYAVAAFRLLPSFNRIVGAAMQLRFYRRTIELVHGTLRGEPPSMAEVDVGDKRRFSIGNGIVISNLFYAYPGTQQPALTNVTLTVPAGGVVGIVGPSGAGKSTLVDILLGILDGYQGEVIIDGCVLAPGVVKAWQRLVGYVPQSIYLADDTLKRNIAFGLEDAQIDQRALLAACEAAQLQDVIVSLSKGLDTVVGERGIRLSGGQRQRVGIARALYRNPSVLILDEATSALDGLTEHEIARQIDLLAGEKTIIIIAHRLSTIRKCKLIHVLEAGTLTGSGSYQELASRSDYLSKLQSIA